MVMGMVLVTDRKMRGSKMERRGMRTARSKRKKRTEKTRNLNTAMGRKVEGDKQRGRKRVVQEKARARMLHTGPHTDMTLLEIGDHPF